MGESFLWYGFSAIPDGFEIYSPLQNYFPLGGETVNLVGSGQEEHYHQFAADAISYNTGHTHTVTPGSVSGSSQAEYGYGSDYAGIMGHSSFWLSCSKWGA